MVGTRRQLLLMAAFMASSCDAFWWGSIKQDCGVSLWSKWSPSQDRVTRTRTRAVYRKPQNGGVLCPVLSETETNVWNPQRPAAEIATAIDTTFLSSRSVTYVTNGRRRRQTPTILPRDILFIVDMSGSIGKVHFENAKRNIANLVEKICGDVGQDRLQNRVAVISFSSNAVINFFFKDHMTIQQVEDAIMSIPYEGGGTCLHKALQKAADVFRTDKGMRSDVSSVKEAVILTDGRWNCGVDDPTIYNMVASLSASLSNNIRPIAIYAFVIKLLPGQADQEKFDRIVTAPVQNHLFAFTGLSHFTMVVNLILDYEGCAPFVVGGK